jgi:hypothetical protein
MASAGVGARCPLSRAERPGSYSRRHADDVVLSSIDPWIATIAPTCFLEDRKEHLRRLKTVGPAALERFREAGDPAKHAEARRKIGAKNAARNRERAAWDREHGPQDPEVFRTEILPILAGSQRAGSPQLPA